MHNNLWEQALASLDFVERGQHIVMIGAGDWRSITSTAAWANAQEELSNVKPYLGDTEAEGLNLANSDLCSAYGSDILDDTNTPSTREMTSDERAEFERIG